MHKAYFTAKPLVIGVFQQNPAKAAGGAGSVE